MDGAVAAIVNVDGEGRITSANASAEVLFGARTPLLVGKHLTIEPLHELLAGPTGRQLELPLMRPERPPLLVELTLIGASTLLLREIVDGSADRTFRALLEAAPDAVVVVNQQGRIAIVNSQTEAFFGYPRAELIGEPVDCLVPERLRGAGHFLEAHARGLELFGLRKDGTEFPIEISLSPLETEEGVLVSSAIRDITERKVTEIALKTANRELEAFSYSVAHDLRAPLRGMNGFAQLLLHDYHAKLDETGKDWLNEVLLNARRMDDLIDALLSLSRMSRAELHLEWVDLSAMAGAIMAKLQASDRARVVQVIIEARLRAELDPRLAQALLENLLGNAWKFTGHREGARIEIGADMKGDVCVFHVRDNGAGFDMAFADKLFAPFQRLHGSTEFAGTGIGLATAQRIVHRHGGTIWAEGEVGKGATFYFGLPTLGGRT